MENNEDSTPLEVLAPSAIMAMEKAQIDMQIATAHQYPRSLEQFKRRALAMATLDPETAESCVYVRPVGKEQNAQGKWVDKYAEGPSIRLAEIVAVPDTAFDGAALLVSVSGANSLEKIRSALIEAGASVRSSALVGSHATRYTVPPNGAKP